MHVCVCVPSSKLQTGFQWEVTTPFQLSPDRGVLGPGQECRVTVVFRPQEALVYQREASCAFGDDGETTCTVLLQGICEWQLCGVLLSIILCIRNRNVYKNILSHATCHTCSDILCLYSGQQRSTWTGEHLSKHCLDGVLCRCFLQLNTHSWRSVPLARRRAVKCWTLAAWPSKPLWRSTSRSSTSLL